MQTLHSDACLKNTWIPKALIKKKNLILMHMRGWMLYTYVCIKAYTVKCTTMHLKLPLSSCKHIMLHCLICEAAHISTIFKRRTRLSIHSLNMSLCTLDFQESLYPLHVKPGMCISPQMRHIQRVLCHLSTSR